jgi:hypothetical protein
VRGALPLAVLILVFAVGCGDTNSFPPDFESGDFHGATIDNRWYSLIPGTQFVYRGVKEGKSARDLVLVTRGSKRVLGVPTTVVHDRLFLDGELAEETDDWYAQDEDGNVWYFGEATREFESGKVTSTEGSWQAGVGGASPGLIMEASPRVGHAYAQEHFAGQAEDHAQVLNLSAKIGGYAGAQLTKEWTPLEPGVIDHKYYVPGVGLVREATAKGPQETLVLVRKRSG